MRAHQARGHIEVWHCLWALSSKNVSFVFGSLLTWLAVTSLRHIGQEGLCDASTVWAQSSQK
jgi:hypothetical protein